MLFTIFVCFIFALQWFILEEELVEEQYYSSQKLTET